MTAIVAGLAFGAGLLLIGTGLVGRRPALAVVLARLDQPRQPTRTNTPNPGRQPTLLARVVGERLAGTSLGERVAARMGTDLRTVGQPAVGQPGAELLAAIAAGAVIGVLCVPVVAAVLAAGGIQFDATLTIWVAVTVGVAGAWVPVFSLRARAARRRQAFRHALSCFLDLVAIRLAGGAGIDTALVESATAGHGWAFDELRYGLSRSRLAGRPPWQGFARLGTELCVAELSELAGSMALAGDEGARVRVSLAAKAAAMRTRALTDAERNAQAASERMSLPIVVLMAGFVVFLGYPAVVNVVHGI